MSTKKDQTETAGKTPATYSKAQLLAAKRFTAQKDVLSAVLVDGEQYTMADAERLVEDFAKRKVE